MPSWVWPLFGVDQDPNLLRIDLHCERDKHYGTYHVELDPDDQKLNRDVDLNIHWNCVTDERERWLSKDEERSPSHLKLAPLMGVGSMSGSSASRTDLAYGFQFGAFRSFGGIGPTFEYEFLSHRLNGDPGTSLLFPVTQRGLVGARLPISHRIEFQPLFGFYDESLLQGTTSVLNAFLPEAALRTTVHLMELQDRTWFDLIGEFHYFLPSQASGFDLSSGYEVDAKLQTSHFFSNGWGVNWFLGFGSRRLVGTSTQTDSLFLLGVSCLLGN